MANSCGLLWLKRNLSIYGQLANDFAANDPT
jgi:hypothetical protein